MRWICSKKSVQQSAQDARFATAAEIRLAIEQQRDFLFWLGLLITGDEVSAEKSVVDASGLSPTGGGVFVDWLNRWAGYATARSAVGRTRELIAASARQYVGYSCDHSDHEILTSDQISRLRECDPRQISGELDPLARSTLALRGIQRLSISECALLLNIPRGCVVAAYCKALEWSKDRAEVACMQ